MERESREAGREVVKAQVNSTEHLNELHTYPSHTQYKDSTPHPPTPHSLGQASFLLSEDCGPYAESCLSLEHRCRVHQKLAQVVPHDPLWDVSRTAVRAAR